MKSYEICLTLLLVVLLVSPAMADGVYDNGPINGNVDAWTINFGFAVSNTFTLNGGSLTGLSFGAWLFPGDTNLSVEVSVTSDEFGGTTYFDETVNFTPSNCFSNGYGFNVCTESGSFGGPNLGGGTYWLNLQNASVSSGDPVYWDENSGVGCQGNGCPSLASENSIGTIPSESFTLHGPCSAKEPSPDCGPPPSPEPGTLWLMGSGVLALLGAAHRRMF